ncbi:hypothetical protein CMK13_18015 [Candidatus Poribacteria bacterium]|nr:hypothetical protein [Candidatus Poribacteria bacterium]|tara:strand:+ start:1158 stop:1883 length:726 start_codon:yes stop_codon:yes gene_type:complete
MAAVAAIVGGVATAVGGAVAAGQAHKAMRGARNAKNEAKYKMEQAILDRRDITNPYAGVTDLSGLASDLSSQITNPFNNLTVSTAAAEMQAEETDIALANTLDTLEQTGASAGGATALAMAALKSKKDVAVSISEQEAANAQAKAQGEANMQKEKVAAQTRYQDLLIEQGERDQQADIEGEIFMYQANEARSNADIERYQGMYQGFAAQQNQARIAKGKASASMIGGIGDAIGGVFSSDES